MGKIALDVIVRFSSYALRGMFYCTDETTAFHSQMFLKILKGEQHLYRPNSYKTAESIFQMASPE